MPDRGHAVRVHVEEAEDLGLGVAEGVKTVPGSSAQSSGRSMTIFMPTAQSRWWCPAGRPKCSSSCRPTAPTGPSPTTVRAARMSMPGMKPASGLPCLSVPWSIRRTPGDRSSSISGFGHRRARPDLHRAGGHDLRPTHWVNWPDGEDQPALLVQEWRHVGQLEGVVPGRAARPQRADRPVGQTQRGRAAAGADGIEQIETFSRLTGAAMGICAGRDRGRARGCRGRASRRRRRRSRCRRRARSRSPGAAARQRPRSRWPACRRG